MIREAEIISIQTGLPREIGNVEPWTTGFLKQPMTEPLWLGSTNLEGDGQADLVHHGGTHKAVCVYSAEHYPYWRETLKLAELPWGSFGENFTVGQLTEKDFCIGDVWQIGAARVQVSQPRQPCWKLARRWNIKDLALQVQETGYTGWYFRVLVEGSVQRGMTMSLTERPCPEWTVAAANHLMHHDKKNLDAAASLAALSLLSPSWKETLGKRVARVVGPDERKRLDGS